jgi:hypothetical protein
MGHLLILGFPLLRAYRWRFLKREQGLALGIGLNCYHGWRGLDHHYRSHSRDICAVYLAISSMSVLGVSPASIQLSIALSRPWVLLFREPIIFLMSLYMSIVYGT